MNSQDKQVNVSASDELPQGLVAKTACGGTLNNSENFPSAVYRGEKVYFCMQACLRLFQQAPDPFMTGEISHPSEDV